MKNTIRVTTTFSFKGETYHPTVVVDLNELAIGDEGTVDFHHLLAQTNAIDTYSYLYEVMQSADLVFAEPVGLVQQCLTEDGTLDLDKFRQLSREQKTLQQLSAIAKACLDIEDLEQRPDIAQALREAYELGRSKSHA